MLLIFIMTKHTVPHAHHHRTEHPKRLQPHRCGCCCRLSSIECPYITRLDPIVIQVVGTDADPVIIVPINRIRTERLYEQELDDRNMLLRSIARKKDRNIPLELHRFSLII